MKRLIALIILIMLLLPSCCSASADPIELPQSVRYTVTEVVDRRYTPPDDYELLYRTYLSNGLIVEHWQEVSREEYERSKNDGTK